MQPGVHGTSSASEKFHSHIQVKDQTKEVFISSVKICCGGLKRHLAKYAKWKMGSVHFSCVYLQVLLWVWFFTVFTFYDPPFARVCYVLFELFSFHGHMAMFVGTSNNFERASFQVSLF